MYIYDYFLKDGSRKQFFTDNQAFVPDEVLDFVGSHKEEIINTFCDHFCMTVESFLDGKELKDHQVICKYYEEED